MNGLEKIAYELNAALDEHGGSGEFKTDAGKVFWYYSDNGDANTDHMWELYCDVSDIVSKVSEHKIINSWNDNDSCGFDLELCLDSKHWKDVILELIDKQKNKPYK